MKRTFAVFSILFLAISVLANGWSVTTHYYSIPKDRSTERIEQIFLLNGYMKMVNGNLTTIFNLEENQIIYINNVNRTYWKGDPSKFNTEVRTELEMMIEEKLYGIEKEQQEVMRAMYNEMIDASFPTTTPVEQRTKTFSAHKEKEGETISNYSATKYKILEEGLYLETLWVTKDLPISNDFNFIDLSHFLNQLASGAYATSFESSAQYFKLIEGGYPVKVQIQRGDGSVQISEVSNAERVNLTPRDFSVPKGYRPGSLSDVGVWDGYL